MADRHSWCIGTLRPFLSNIRGAVAKTCCTFSWFVYCPFLLLRVLSYSANQWLAVLLELVCCCQRLCSAERSIRRVSKYSSFSQTTWAGLLDHSGLKLRFFGYGSSQQLLFSRVEDPLRCKASRGFSTILILPPRWCQGQWYWRWHLLMSAIKKKGSESWLWDRNWSEMVKHPSKESTVRCKVEQVKRKGTLHT